MDIHTLLTDIIPLTSSTLAVLPQVLPLPWKVDSAHTNSFNITAKRDMQTHQELWTCCAFVLPKADEVRFALSVMTTVSDAYEAGIQPGWTAVITQTTSATISITELQAVLTDPQAEANLLTLMHGRADELNVRRQALASEVPNA
jgi:hypothetical protein